MLPSLLTALIWIGSLQVGDSPKAADSKVKATSGQPAPKTASNDDLARQVNRLVRQLDDAAVAARDAAYAELVKLGPDVLDHLPKAADNPPAAVRDALRRLRREFDEQAADRAMQASTFTLHGKGIPLKQVAEAFEKQTGNKITIDESAADAAVDLDLEKVPFWKALDGIAEEAKLTVYSFAQEGPQLRPALPNQTPRGRAAFYNGPLRFEARDIQLRRDLRSKTDPSLTVGLEIAWEPRLRPITLLQKLSALNAVDENGDAIEAEGEGELPALVHQGSSAVEMELPFHAPARTVKSVASLKGTMEVLVPGKLEMFEFAALDKAKKTEQQRHNATVTLESARKVNEVWEIRIRVKYGETFNAFDSHLVSWILNNEAYLLDAKGERVENAGLETTHRSEDEIGVAYVFEAAQGLAGHKFIYQTPGTIYRLPVKYELKELVLP